MTPRRGTLVPSMVKPSSLASTAFDSLPATESCLSRKAMVSLSPMGSLSATSSTPASAPRSRSARVNERPIRPKPLIPTRTAICLPPYGYLDYSRARNAFANRRGSWARPWGRATSAPTGSTPSDRTVSVDTARAPSSAYRNVSTRAP